MEAHFTCYHQVAKDEGNTVLHSSQEPTKPLEGEDQAVGANRDSPQLPGVLLEQVTLHLCGGAGHEKEQVSLPLLSKG